VSFNVQAKKLIAFSPVSSKEKAIFEVRSGHGSIALGFI